MKGVKLQFNRENVLVYISYFLWVILLVCSMLMMGVMKKSRLFPTKIIISCCALCIIVLAFLLFLSRRKQNWSCILASVISIFIISATIFAVCMIRNVLNTLNNLTSTGIQTESVIAVVLKDSLVTDIGETGNLRFGDYFDSDKELRKEAYKKIGEMNGNQDLSANPYQSILELSSALINNDIDIAVFNKGYSGILEEALPEFSNNTRIIYESDFAVHANADEKVEKTQAESIDTKEKQIFGESINVYISGIYIEEEKKKKSRSDVNIIMTVNPFTNTILLTTTPRDYFVYIPEVSGDMRDKLTHAGIYGVDASIRTLENLYGVDIDNYLRINFDSLIELVDAIGGIDVYSEYAFSGRGYTFEEGINHLNGEEALVFARERYAFSEGDNQRGKNQMAVIQAIIDKLQSPAILKNSEDVLHVVEESMQTDFTADEISEMISWQLANAKEWNVEQQAVYGSGDMQQTYSMRGMELYVMWPDDYSVTQAAERIMEVKKEKE